MFVTTLVVTVFAFLFAFTQPVNAAGPAKWENGKLIYESHTYDRRDDIKPEMMKRPEGSKILTYTDPVKMLDENADKTINVIYFEKDIDPLKAEKANFVVYKYDPPYGFTNPSGKTTVSFSEQSKAEADEQTTSCAIEGIGWIVCPLTNFLSEAMDKLFKVMSEFLTVRPVQTDQESPLYRAWSMMRNIANVAFVMAFLIVIYSQLSNIGLSTHGIKRMLPRLIVAAILVNVSYWICAVAVDLSNIFGYSLYDLFIGMKDNLVGAEGNGWEKITWHDLGAFILAGGTAAAAAGIGIYAFAAGAGAGIFMLLPILLGVLISALVALLVMAARQALITILIIVAPLAFVAYLLPNTEKYFKKWQDLFTTMLLIFPMFAIVLGGAQLAGDAIIQNAGSSVNLVILGMAVKVAPVVITPFLLKFSGSLLGKIAGVVNNPGKGLLDRTRNFAQERRDSLASRQMANTKNPNALARAAQRIDSNKRKREGWKKANDSRRDATWANSQDYATIHGYGENSNRIKQIGENSANEHYANALQNNAAIQGLDIRARASKLDVDVSEAKVEANWEAVKAGKPDDLVVMAAAGGTPTNVLEAINRSPDASRDLALTALRRQAAERVQTLERGTQLMDNTATIDGVSLQQFAGGIDPNGAQRALSEALTKQHAARSEAVKNAQAVIEHKNLSDADVRKLALGNAGTSGIALTDDVQEAAIKMVAGGKNAKEIDNLLEAMDVSATSNDNHRIALYEALGANGLRPKYITGSALGKIRLGQQPLGESGIDSLIQEAVKKQKLSPAALADQDPAHLERILEAIDRNKAGFDTAGLNKLRDNIIFAKDPKNQLAGKLGDGEPVLDEILRKL